MRVSFSTYMKTLYLKIYLKYRQNYVISSFQIHLLRLFFCRKINRERITCSMENSAPLKDFSEEKLILRQSNKGD